MRAKRSWLNRRLPYVYGALIIIGFLLIDWAGYDLLLPDPAPYRYELIAEGTIANFPDLALSSVPQNLTIRKFEARLDKDGSAFAALYIVDPGPDVAPILLDWQNRSSELALAIPSRTEDLDQLAEAVKLHIPEDAVMLGWWDINRQLHALTGVKIFYDANFPRPLFIPPAWDDDLSAIESLERVFWRISENGTEDFGRFLDALSSEVEAGSVMLKGIAEGRKGFIVVQLSDAYKLALARPNLVRVSYRDFAVGGDIHDDIMQVKKWLGEKGFGYYAVESFGIAKKRVYYLEDSVTANTLLAQMLPFGEFNPLALSGLKLVANYGSYWVYEIESENAAVD